MISLFMKKTGEMMKKHLYVTKILTFVKIDGFR